jgi:hypothetical protein
MSSLAEMRKQLREARKETVKPVSRMRKGDVLLELEKLKGSRESVPPVASTVGAKGKKMMSSVADVKVAKEASFPMKPVEESKATKSKGVAAAKTPGAMKKATKSTMKFEDDEELVF